MGKKYLLLGGTGLVGRALTESLLSQNCEVKILTRSKHQSDNPNLSYHQWNPENGSYDYEILRDIDTVIHVAGEPIFEKAWKGEAREELRTSRQKMLKIIISGCEKLDLSLPQLTIASAVGYYGYFHDNPKQFSEEDVPLVYDNNAFPARIIRGFENYIDRIRPYFDCVSVLRLGVVLSREGGYYARLRPVIKLFLGSAFGDGQAHMPFIHIEDLVSMFHFVEGKAGIYNAVCPEDLSLMKFNILLNKYLNRFPLLPKVPRFIIERIFGEKSVMLLDGQSVSARKMLDAGFEYQYPDLKSCVKQLESPAP